MSQALFYTDAHSLTAYLGGAALLEPTLAAARCEDLTLLPARARAKVKAGDSALKALFFADPELRLPTPAESIVGTRLCQATFERSKGELVVKMGGRRRRFRLASPSTGQRALARALPPLPWSGAPPSAPEVIYLCPEGAPFARLVTQHLELGRGELRYAAIGDGRMLLEVLEPSWFLLERWLQEDAREVTVFRRLSSPLGLRRIYVEWGYSHALETWLTDPEDEALLLLIDREGEHHTLRQGDLEDIGDVLHLDPAQFGAVQLEAMPRPERVQVGLRLVGRAAPRDPELWLLPVTERHRLEELLTATPEEELRNLLVACVGAAGEDDMFAVREMLTGRAPRLLPLGDRAYASLQGLPGLLVPCDKAITPPLSDDRYARAFALRPGELTLLDDLGDGQITVTKLPERAFRSVDTIVDFVIAGHAREVEQVMLSAPFDLGVFAEEELVPKARAPRRAVPKERKRKPARDLEAKPERPRSKSGRSGALLDPLRASAKRTSPTRPTPARRDARQRKIESVQRELVLEQATPDRWLELSGLLFEDGRREEALRAVENAVWDLEQDRASAIMKQLATRLGEPSPAPPLDTLALYQYAFAYLRETAGTTGDVASYRHATEGVYAALRQHEDRLRKRSRWLLWRTVLLETGDAIEVERQREAILSDLVVRGLEEREVPAFVRSLLLEHYGQKAATGSGASAALAFLERAQRFAGSLKHPAYQAAAKAQVAWAFAELGQGERSLEITALALRQARSERGAPPHEAWRARAVARVGAVYERVRGRDFGRPQLESALAQIARQFPAEPTRRQDQEQIDARKALVAWLGAAADGWTSDDRPGDPLIEAAFALIEGLPPNVQSQVIHDAPDALKRLGLGERTRALAWRLLRPEELKRARARVIGYQYPDDAYRVHVQNVVESLEPYREGEPVTVVESRAIVGLFRAHPTLIDEFSIQPLRVALRGVRRDPWELVEELVAELRQRRRVYEAQLVRIAGLWRLAELRERQRGADLLEEALAESWRLEPDPKKPPHRVLTRLVHLVPAFGMRERGLRILHGVNERSQAQGDEGVYFRNELLLSTAIAGSKLGDSRAAFDLIQRTAHMAIAEFEGRERSERAGGPGWLLFETLDECVRGSLDLGEVRRGLKLIGSVADTARTALERAREAQGQGAEGPYFYCRSLIRCGAAALALGDPEGAQAHFDTSFAHFHSLSNFDLTDILQETAEVAGHLEGTHRYQLAGQVLEVAESPVADGGQDRFAMQLVGQIAGDMVRGESAFASALKRWKGREERSIRDLVAHEPVVRAAPEPRGAAPRQPR